jgi:uncharacterized protein with GYD domain
MWRTGHNNLGGGAMPTYVILMNLTEQGVKNIKEAPARIDAATKALEAGGGKMIGFYTLMGDFDYLAIIQGPNDQAALTQLIGLGMQGNVRTKTLKAFTKEEYAEMIKKLP